MLSRTETSTVGRGHAAHGRRPRRVAFAQQPAETTIPDKVRLFIPYKEYSQEDNKRMLEMYKWLRVADVSDGMDVVGLQDVGIVDPGDPRALEGHGEIHASHRWHRGDRALRADEPPRAEDGAEDHQPVVQHHHLRGVHEGARAGQHARHRCDGGRRVAQHRLVAIFWPGRSSAWSASSRAAASPTPTRSSTTRCRRGSGVLREAFDPDATSSSRSIGR